MSDHVLTQSMPPPPGQLPQEVGGPPLVREFVDSEEYERIQLALNMMTVPPRRMAEGVKGYKNCLPFYGKLLIGSVLHVGRAAMQKCSTACVWLDESGVLNLAFSPLLMDELERFEVQTVPASDAAAIAALRKSTSGAWFVAPKADLPASIRRHLDRTWAYHPRERGRTYPVDPLVVPPGHLVAVRPDYSQIVAVCVHELLHVAYLHLLVDRTEFNDPRIANIAMDVSINQYIDSLPEWCVTIASYARQSLVLEPDQPFEVYYYKLLEFYAKKRKRDQPPPPADQPVMMVAGLYRVLTPDQILSFVHDVPNRGITDVVSGVASEIRQLGAGASVTPALGGSGPAYDQLVGDLSQVVELPKEAAEELGLGKPCILVEGLGAPVRHGPYLCLDMEEVRDRVQLAAEYGAAVSGPYATDFAATLALIDLALTNHFVVSAGSRGGEGGGDGEDGGDGEGGEGGGEEGEGSGRQPGGGGGKEGGEEGSGSGGEPGQSDGGDVPGTFDDHEPWKRPSKIDHVVTRDYVGRFRSEAEKSKAWGDLPGDMTRQIEKFLKPKVRWEPLLRRFIGDAIRIGVEKTRKRPSRRMGWDAPGRKIVRSGRIWVAIDNSGSVSQTEAAQFMGEIGAFIDQIEVIAIVWDTMITSAQLITSRSQLFKLAKNMGGGGGTNVHVVFDALKNPGGLSVPAIRRVLTGERPSGLVVLTDGDLQWPEPEWAIVPTLWAITQERNVKSPKFGFSIFLDASGK